MRNNCFLVAFLSMILILFVLSCCDCNNGTTENELPDLMYPSQDVFVRGGSYSDQCMQVYSPATSIQLSADYDFSYDRTYIQFNCSSIPKGTIIESAILHLKVSASYMPGQVQLMFLNVLSPWTETTTTYNHQPSIGGSAWVDFPSSFTVGNWYSQDATNAVQFWVNNPSSNFGLKIGMTDYGAGPDWAYVGFWSNDAINSDRPYITIEY
jgi:hypothetical protein